MRRRLLASLRVAVLVLALVCLAWALVRTLGLERGYPLVALVVFTPYAALVALGAALLAALLRAWPAVVAAAVSLILLASAVVPRMLGSDEPSDRRGEDSLTVLALNLSNGEADPTETLSLIRDHDPDVVFLAELNPPAMVALNGAGLDRVMPERVLSVAPGGQGTGVFAVGDLRRLPGVVPGLGSAPMARAELRLGDGRELEVVSVHPRAPTDADAAERWEASLEALPNGGVPGRQLLAGDFNASLDHAVLRDLLDTGYVDAADEVGRGLAPTWPEMGSAALPITIDHVLAEEGIEVLTFETAAVAGTDHRAVISELSVPGSDS